MSVDINPLDSLIVATAALEEVQTPPATDEVKVVFKPEQTVVTPLNVPADGFGLIVIILVAIDLQPLEPVIV